MHQNSQVQFVSPGKTSVELKHKKLGQMMIIGWLIRLITRPLFRIDTKCLVIWDTMCSTRSEDQENHGLSVRNERTHVIMWGYNDVYGETSWHTANTAAPERPAEWRILDRVWGRGGRVRDATPFRGICRIIQVTGLHHVSRREGCYIVLYSSHGLES